MGPWPIQIREGWYSGALDEVVRVVATTSILHHARPPGPLIVRP